MKRTLAALAIVAMVSTMAMAAEEGATSKPATTAASTSASSPAGKAGAMRAGQAQVAYAVDDKGNLVSAKFQAAVEEAYQKALAQYGPGTPKIILVMTTLPPGQAKAIGFVHEKLGRGAPMYGMGNGSYTVVGYNGFLGEKQLGLTVLALGGEGIAVQTSVVRGFTMKVKEWELKAQAEKTGAKEEDLRNAEIKKHADWGKELAQGVKPVAGKTNIFLQYGTQHTPRMTWVHQGTTAVLGKDVYIFGSAASDFGFVWYKGEIISDALLGVLISGDLKVSMAGSDSPGEDATAQAKIPGIFREKLGTVISEIGGKPQVLFYSGCVGWRFMLPEQQQVAQELLGGTVPLFGCFAGGEIGRYTTTGEPIAEPGQLMLMGISAK